MKWTEMTSEQKNALIHEKVMGVSLTCHATLDIKRGQGFYFWNCFECGYFSTGKDSPITNDHPRQMDIPPYTTDMNAAWLIIQKMSTRHHEQSEFLDEPFARFTDELLPNRAGEIWTAYNCMATEVAHWTAEKICMAALKACGVEIE